MDWGVGNEVLVSLILLIHSRCHEESLDSAPQPARCQRGGVGRRGWGEGGGGGTLHVDVEPPVRDVLTAAAKTGLTSDSYSGFTPATGGRP